MGRLKASDNVKNQYALYDTGKGYLEPGFDNNTVRREYGSF